MLQIKKFPYQHFGSKLVVVMLCMVAMKDSLDYSAFHLLIKVMTIDLNMNETKRNYDLSYRDNRDLKLKHRVRYIFCLADLC